MKIAKVEEVIYYLLGQDYKTRTDQPKIWNKNVKGKGRWYPRKNQQAYGAKDYDFEYEEEFEVTYVQVENETYEEEEEHWWPMAWRA